MHARNLLRPRRLLVLAGATLAVVIAVTAVLHVTGSRATPPASPDANVGVGADGPMRLHVDPALAPATATVPGLVADDPPRPVGRLQNPAGEPMDLVLDEIVVSYRQEADLDRFVAAIGGTVADRFDDAAEPVRDALVRFPRYQVDDPATVAARMAALESDLAGEWSVSDSAVLAVLDLVGKADEAGVTAMPNVLAESTGFADGSTNDGNSPYGRDAFTWPYVASGTAQDIGLDAAWRLLADTGGLDRRVRIMVVDQGFRLNDDVPAARWIRRADWGEQAAASYGAAWHGALVVNALAGAVDNGFGGAGPAGPVAELVAVGDAETNWGSVRSLVRLVDEYRPHIVNMSYASRITTTRLAYQDFYERKFSNIKHDYGALPFASAGNDSRNIDSKASGAVVERALYLPCEAKHVVCVGGMGEDTTARAVGGCGDAAGSNFGTKTGGRSVEIWGPYLVVAQSGTSGSPGSACGTSFASPFVAGVAALVKAADPTLGPDGIWNILKQTAHDKGDIGAEVTGHQRRINAAEAVRRAYGGIVLPPRVEITSPRAGDTARPGQWVDLAADAYDHQGRALAVSWESSRDGKLASPSTLPTFTESLSIGTHVITATVTDRLGSTASASVTMEVVNRPVEVSVSLPDPGRTVPMTEALSLLGHAFDPTSPLDPLDDAGLRWSILHPAKPNQPVFGATGAAATVPAGTLPPGPYLARLSATVLGKTTSAQVAFTVVPPDPGQPTAVITAPQDAASYVTATGEQAVRLIGHASDANGAMSGTRLRWIARDGSGQQRVLCRGSATPGGATGTPGGFAATVDCSDVTVDLPGALGGTAWGITLEAYGSTAQPGTDTVGVTVHFKPPPVG